MSTPTRMNASARGPFAESCTVVEAGSGHYPLPRIVPVSLMRQIDQELESNQLDIRIVSHLCRGLAHGSIGFERAYIAARMDAFSRQIESPRQITTYALPVYVTTLPSIQEVCHNRRSGRPVKTSSVLHGGHLMEHFGTAVIALLALQFLCCYHLGDFANRLLGGGVLLHIAAWMVFMGCLNFGIWLRCYGKPASEFHLPAAFLVLMAILPSWVLHLLLSLPGIA